MATENTSLLQKSINLPDKNKVMECTVLVTLPKQTIIDDDSWSALTRDQLLSCVNDPFWCAIRKLLMIIFWISLLAMFTSAIVIASVEHHGSCAIQLNMINLKGIQSSASTVGLISTLSFIDESNLTNSFAT